MFEKYPIKATIFNVRGSNIYIEHDLATRLFDQKKKKHVFKLKRKREEIIPKDYVNILVGKNGKPHIFLISPAPNQYYSLSTEELVNNKKLFPLIDENVREWVINTTIKANTMFSQQSWIEKYLPIIAVAVIAIVAVFFLVVTLDKAIEIMNIQVSGGQKISQGIDSINSFLNSSLYRGSTNVIAPPPIPPVGG